MRTGRPRKNPLSTDLELGVKYIARVRDDPVWFAQQVLRHRALEGEPTLAQDPARSWELDEFQLDLLNAVADIWRKKTVINHERKTNLTVVSGHGPGKTHTAALIAHYFNACWPGRVIVTAPKYDQVKTRLFAAIHKIDLRAEPAYRQTHEVGETTAYWKTPTGERDHNWCILAETAKQPENLAGHHAPYQLVIVEEATGVPEALFPVILGALSTGVIQVLVMISNGTRRTGTFADSHLKPREMEHYFRYHISFDKSHRVSREWARRLVSKYGAESPIVKVRVLGEFASDDPNQLIALQWIADARAADIESDGSIPRRRISIDVAGGGVCENVLVLGNHYQTKLVLHKIKRCSFELSVTTQKTADVAEQLWRDFGLEMRNGDDFVVDAIGPGLGVGGELLKRGYPVVFHQGGASSDDPKRWRNRRTQSYLACRNAFRDRQVVLGEQCLESQADWDDLEAQLTSLRTKDNGDRVEDLETKAELVARLGFSPDIADALSMQWSAMAPATQVGEQHSGSTEQPMVIVSHALDGLFRG